MSTLVNWNGQQYLVPAYNDTGYAQGNGNLSQYLVALSTGSLQQVGGLFQLTADADFGPNFGLVSSYYKSRTANIASAGVLRLANTDAIKWRNSDNSADVTLAMNATGTAARTYTIPDLATSSFVMTEGTQSINGTKTFADLRGTLGANLAAGGFKLTGLAAGSGNGDSLRYEQLVGAYLPLGGGTLTGALLLADGAAATPGIAFSGETNTGIYRNGAGYFAFSVGGSNRFQISATAVQTLVPITIPDGTAAAPSLSFSNDLNTGIYIGGADILSFATGGTSRGRFSSTSFQSDVPIQAADGTAAAPALSFGTDTNTGVYLGGADTLSFSTGGTSRARFTSVYFQSDVRIESANQPSFNVILNATVNDVTGDGTVYTVAFDTEIFDVGGNFNTGTYTFTAPVAGKYLLSAQIRTQGASANGLASDVVIVTSNRSYYSSWPAGATAGTSSMHNITVVADMDASDTAYVTVSVAGGTKLVDLNNGYARFSGYLLG